MNNLDSNEEEITVCMACIGSAELYDDVTDTCCECKYCNGKGEATRSQNEYFLSVAIFNN